MNQSAMNTDPDVVNRIASGSGPYHNSENDALERDTWSLVDNLDGTVELNVETDYASALTEFLHQYPSLREAFFALPQIEQHAVTSGGSPIGRAHIRLNDVALMELAVALQVASVRLWYAPQREATDDPK